MQRKRITSSTDSSRYSTRQRHLKKIPDETQTAETSDTPETEHRKITAETSHHVGPKDHLGFQETIVLTRETIDILSRTSNQI
jgi:hypothetical protein